MEEKCENDEIVWNPNWTVIPTGITIRPTPTPQWKWDFFGDGYTMMITTCAHIPWWKRLTTKILLGSRWERL